jgi:hypothetical protein
VYVQVWGSFELFLLEHSLGRPFRLSMLLCVALWSQRTNEEDSDK